MKINTNMYVSDCLAVLPSFKAEESEAFIRMNVFNQYQRVAQNKITIPQALDNTRTILWEVVKDQDVWDYYYNFAYSFMTSTKGN